MNRISRDALHLQLTEWESRLPAEMRLENQSTPSAIFLTGLLHMTYKYVPNEQDGWLGIALPEEFGGAGLGMCCSIQKRKTGLSKRDKEVNMQ